MRRPAVGFAPFAFEALVVGVADELGDVDDARRDGVIGAEGVAVPLGHGPVALYRRARRLERAQAVVVVAGMPAPEVDGLHRVQRDVLPVDGVHITAHMALLVRHDGHPVRAQRPDLRRQAAPIPGQEPVGVAGQLQRADRLLDQLEAAQEGIGLLQQALGGVGLLRDPTLAVQPEDVERHQGGGLGNAVDGHVDPRAAFVNRRLPLVGRQGGPGIGVVPGDGRQVRRGRAETAGLALPPSEQSIQPGEHRVTSSQKVYRVGFFGLCRGIRA